MIPLRLSSLKAKRITETPTGPGAIARTNPIKHPINTEIIIGAWLIMSISYDKIALYLK